MAMFGKLGQAADSAWRGMVTLVGTAVIAITPIYEDELRAKTGANDFVMIGAIVAGCAASVLGVILTERHSASVRKDLNEERANGRAEIHILFGRLFPRITEKLGALAAATTAPKKVSEHKAFISHVIGQVQGQLQEEEVPVRVNYYRLFTSPDGPYLLAFEHTESVDRPRLDSSTPEGELILNRVLGGDDAYCADLLKSDDRRTHVRENDRAHKYRCFSSVVVRLGSDGYGMLSANTSVPQGLKPESLRFLSVIGGIIAVAERLRGEIAPQDIEGRDIIGISDPMLLL